MYELWYVVLHIQNRYEINVRLADSYTYFTVEKDI